MATHQHPWPSVGSSRRVIGRLALRLFGWRTEGQPPPYAKAVFIAAPHTSNWDLYFMLGVAWSMGLQPSWFGKHTLFGFPFGPFFRFLGGVPIDRRAPRNYVERSIDGIRRQERLYFVVPPSGTRKKTDAWKSGFYYIALGAEVPICCAFLDYRRKVGGIGPTFTPTGDVKADMDKIRAFYSNVTPLYPALKSVIRISAETSETPDKPVPAPDADSE